MHDLVIRGGTVVDGTGALLSATASGGAGSGGGAEAADLTADGPASSPDHCT